MPERYKIPMFYGRETVTDNRALFEHMRDMCSEELSKEIRRELSHWFGDLFPGVQKAMIAAAKESDILTGDKPAGIFEYLDGKWRASCLDGKWTDWHAVDASHTLPVYKIGARVIGDTHWVTEGNVGTYVSPSFKSQGTLWIAVLWDGHDAPTCQKARSLVPWHKDWHKNNKELKDEGYFPEYTDTPWS